MPNETGTETTRPDTPNEDDSLSHDAPATVVEKEADNEQTAQDAHGSADAGDNPDAEAKADAPEDLKVVVSIKGGRATIGVQQPSSDPHVETFGDADLSGLAHEVPAVTERARAKWQETPKHPAYVRPAPPARRRNRRQQQGAQASTAEGAAEPEQAQTPRLF